MPHGPADKDKAAAARNSQEGPVRPVEPAVARHDTPTLSMSQTGNYPP